MSYQSELQQAQQLLKHIREESAKRNRLLNKYNIVLSTIDGSFIHYTSGTCIIHNEFLLIFTEHNGDHIYHTSDLTYFRQLVVKPIKKLQIKTDQNKKKR